MICDFCIKQLSGHLSHMLILTVKFQLYFMGDLPRFRDMIDTDGNYVCPELTMESVH